MLLQRTNRSPARGSQSHLQTSSSTPPGPIIRRQVDTTFASVRTESRRCALAVGAVLRPPRRLRVGLGYPSPTRSHGHCQWHSGWQTLRSLRVTVTATEIGAGKSLCDWTFFSASAARANKLRIFTVGI